MRLIKVMAFAGSYHAKNETHDQKNPIWVFVSGSDLVRCPIAQCYVQRVQISRYTRINKEGDNA